MDPIRVGLIGYGLSGSAFHAPIIEAVPTLELAGIVSSRPERVRRDFPEMQVADDVDGLLEDPSIELVVVATPNRTHRDLAARALRAGKHSVVEKPLVLRSEEADDLIRLARERDLLLSVYHNRRWDGDFLTIRRLVGEGALGEVVVFESRFDRYRPRVKEGWREVPGEGSGVLWDLGPHLVDQALVLFGPPETVWADVGTQRPEAVADDYFHLVLGWGRRRALLHAGALVRDPGPRFAVHGTDGSFTKHGLDPQEEALRGGEWPARRDASDWGREPPERHGTLVHGPPDLPMRSAVRTLPGRYQSYYEGIVAALRDAGPNPVPAEDGREAIRVIEAALRSAREGGRIESA